MNPFVVPKLLPRLALLAGAWLLVGASRAHAAGPRDCRLPDESLESAADTAAYCAEGFVARNGYTDALPSMDRSQIVLEGWEMSRSLEGVLYMRRATLRGTAYRVCPQRAGWWVVFRTTAATEPPGGRVVAMSLHFGGMTMLDGSVALTGLAPTCRAPRGS